MSSKGWGLHEYEECHNRSVGIRSVENEEFWNDADCWKWGVLRMRSVENTEFWKWGVLRMRSVENAECWKSGVLNIWSVENLKCWKRGVLKVCGVLKMRSVKNLLLYSKLKCNYKFETFKYNYFFPFICNNLLISVHKQVNNHLSIF